jgi:hypothetical protein
VSAPITLTGIGDAQVEIAISSHALRSEALTRAQAVLAVGDAMDAAEASDALRLLTQLSKQVEAARVEVGKPVLELTRKINATAKDFIGEVLEEKDRLEGILGTFQAAEARKADAARRLAQDEANRFAADAARAQHAVERAVSATEIERSQRAAVELEVKAIEARVAVAAIAAIKPALAWRMVGEGVALRQAWKFEVVDINALFKARPDLCVIEPNNAGIRAQIPHNQSLPGLRIWQEAKASVRS